MKTIIPLFALAAALSWLAQPAGCGAQPADAPGPSIPDKARADVNQALEEARQKFEAARREFEALQKRLGQEMPRYASRLQQVLGRGPEAPDRTLVIRSGDMDAKVQTILEQDLAVMSRILDKTLAEKLGDDSRRRTAMGIDVFFVPGGNPVRSFYLEDYGALFMLNVRFPLVPPPAKVEGQKETPPADSAWEEARRELYGSPDEPRPAMGPSAAYDETKVNTLKDALLDALRNAANIHGLKPADWVTMCVFGADGRDSAAGMQVTGIRTAPLKGGDDRLSFSNATVFTQASPSGGGAYTFGPSSMRGTVMTIRVKKADVDAFAKGKTSADEFRKQVRITSYAGGVGPWRGQPRGVSGSGSVGTRSFFSF